MLRFTEIMKAVNEIDFDNITDEQQSLLNELGDMDLRVEACLIHFSPLLNKIELEEGVLYVDYNGTDALKTRVLWWDGTKLTSMSEELYYHLYLRLSGFLVMIGKTLVVKSVVVNPNGSISDISVDYYGNILTYPETRMAVVREYMRRFLNNEQTTDVSDLLALGGFADRKEMVAYMTLIFDKAPTVTES